MRREHWEQRSPRRSGLAWESLGQDLCCQGLLLQELGLGRLHLLAREIVNAQARDDGPLAARAGHREGVHQPCDDSKGLITDDPGAKNGASSSRMFGKQK
jgi:hypothetical protein